VNFVFPESATIWHAFVSKQRALWSFERQIMDIIADGGESAKSLQRPGMERLLAMVGGKKVQAVIIAKLDRLTRSVKDLVHTAGAVRAPRGNPDFCG